MVRTALRRIVRSTPILPIVRRSRNSRALRAWTDEDERLLQFYEQFVHPGQLVFDVGANMGIRTKVFLRLGASVVAFEPQRDCAAVLRRVCGPNPSFELVPKALGRTPGVGTMLVSDHHELSTLSETWLTATRRSGRFAGATWARRERVEITTLDAAIAQFGTPHFVKIDVEGFEAEVLAGLSQSVLSGSIEFTAEGFATTAQCLTHLSNLDNYRFQVVRDTNTEFEMAQWGSAAELLSTLGTWRQDPMTWGDVYFRRATP